MITLNHAITQNLQKPCVEKMPSHILYLSFIFLSKSLFSFHQITSQKTCETLSTQTSMTRNTSSPPWSGCCCPVSCIVVCAPSFLKETRPPLCSRTSRSSRLCLAKASMSWREMTRPSRTLILPVNQSKWCVWPICFENVCVNGIACYHTTCAILCELCTGRECMHWIPGWIFVM